MQKTQKSGFGTVEIILVIAVLSGGFLYWRDAQWLSGCPKIAKICPDGSTVDYVWPTCKLAECPGGKESEAETVDTSTWKTYRNEQYGFEVRYPPQYLLSETDVVDDKNKKIRDLKTFQLRGDQCKIALLLAGGKGLSKEWIFEDTSFSIDDRDFDARKFYYLDKSHLRWISIYNFPTPQYELQLRASEGIDRDISATCSDTFYNILSTLEWIK